MSSPPPAAAEPLASPTPAQSQKKIDEVLSRLHKLAVESAVSGPAEGERGSTPPSSSRSSSLSQSSSSKSSASPPHHTLHQHQQHVLHVSLLDPSLSASILSVLASLPLPAHTAYIAPSPGVIGNPHDAWLVFHGEAERRDAGKVLLVAGGAGAGTGGRGWVGVRDVGVGEWESVRGRVRVVGWREGCATVPPPRAGDLCSPTTTSSSTSVSPPSSTSGPFPSPTMSHPHPFSFRPHPHQQQQQQQQQTANPANIASLARLGLSSRHPLLPTLSTTPLSPTYSGPFTPFAPSAPPLTPPRTAEHAPPPPPHGQGWPMWGEQAQGLRAEQQGQRDQQQQQQQQQKQAVSFRQGDWICVSPACCYHNFQRNEHCIACGWPRPLPSRSHLPPPTVIPRLSGGGFGAGGAGAGGMSRGGNILTPSGRAFANEGRIRNVGGEECPVVMWWPENEPLPTPGQIRPPMSGMSHPPILNTGNKGPIEHQPGDWYCLKCEYLNWRRRKVCQTCFPFAEGNEDGISPTLQAERIGVLTALFTAAKSAQEAGVPLNLDMSAMLGVGMDQRAQMGGMGAEGQGPHVLMRGSADEYPVFGIGMAHAQRQQQRPSPMMVDNSSNPRHHLFAPPAGDSPLPLGLGLPPRPLMPLGFRPAQPSTPVRLTHPPPPAPPPGTQPLFPPSSSPTRARTSPTTTSPLDPPRSNGAGTAPGSARNIWRSEGSGLAGWPDFGPGMGVGVGGGGGRRVSPGSSPVRGGAVGGEFDRTPGGGAGVGAGQAQAQGVVYLHPRLAGVQRA